MTKVIAGVQEFKDLRAQHLKNLSVGFVPTMGALHEGHVTLLEKARKENDVCVCSIFVNPTQFNSSEDLQKYPRTLNADLEKLSATGADYLFYPDYKEIYADDYRYKVAENSFSKVLCGKFRPGHFDGVLTVVMKLFNIVQPTKSYFGEKDYQQMLLIRDMTKTFFMTTDVVSVPTVRDSHGLALSSRNTRLSEAGLRRAREFAKILASQKNLEEIRQELTDKKFDVEYLEEHYGRKFAAIYIEGVRLIDNVSIA